MKTAFCVLIVFYAITFIQTDGQLFFIDKVPAIRTLLLDGESCDLSKVVPLDLRKSNVKSKKLRNEINDPTIDADESQYSDENASLPVDSQTRPKRESKVILTKTKAPSFMWGNMLSLRSVEPIKNSIDSNGDTGYEIKEFQMKEFTTEKINVRPKRAAKKPPKLIRISLKDIKASKSKVVKKRSIHNDQNNECPAIENLRQRKDLDLNNDMILQYLPEVGNDCPSCGTKYVIQHDTGCQCGECMRCSCMPSNMVAVQHRPHYIEYNNDGTPVTYVPGRAEANNIDLVKSPRYVFDQFGHRYVENNGNLRIVMPDHMVGAASPAPHPDPEQILYFNKIREILYGKGNRDFQNWTTDTEKGELAPPVIDQQLGVLKFLQDIVKNRYNEPSNKIPVTVENAFDDAKSPALQKNRLFVDEDDAKVEDNVIRIK